MGRRKVIFVNGEIYHVYNRSIGGLPIFVDNKANTRVLSVINYYQYFNPSLKYSRYICLNDSASDLYQKKLDLDNGKQVELFCYCLMPNHYHLLIRQLKSNGLSNFVSNFQNSYAKYFNTKNDREGSLFQSMFKAVWIENNEQLLHVGRYIHLNPFSSHLVKSVENIVNYPWSSLRFYANKDNKIVNTKYLLNQFSNQDHFFSFNLDHAEYQRSFDNYKHLNIE